MNAPRHPAGLLDSVVCKKSLQVNGGDLSITGIMMNKDNVTVLSPVELPSLLFYLVAYKKMLLSLICFTLDAVSSCFFSFYCEIPVLKTICLSRFF